ncbi:MAG TPA: hypothetical protein VMS08_00905 [Candidatus Saccharimonadia bacterium]|nr:hypothetical protein [Candidatus Saccharimonadia bacterium]
MSDFGSPVAQNVDVGPQKGLQTISSLLSLKSQQLGIQQQQQGLQGQAAQVQQEQLKAGQEQGVQNFFQQWDPSAHIGSDGTTDVDSALQSPAYQGAGNAKPGIMQSLLDIKNRQLTNKQSLATLNGQLLTQFSQGMGALAKDPDVVSDQADPTTGVNAGRAKVDQFINNFSKLSPDAQRVAQIYGPVTQHAPQGKLSDGIQAIQMQGQDVGGQQAQQNPIPGARSTGMQIIPTVTQKSEGIERAANAPPIATMVPSPSERLPKLGPNAAGQTVAFNPLDPNQAGVAGMGSGAPTYAGPMRPGVKLPPQAVPAAASSGPPGLGVNPTSTQVAQQTTSATAGASNDETAYSQIQQAGSKSKQISSMADDVANLAKSVQTGALSAGAASKWATTLQSLGISNVGADTWEAKRQLLGKMAAQLRIQANVANGANTDAARADVEAAYPNPDTMSPGAVQEAAHYVKGLAQVNQARLNNADKFRAANNGSSLGVRAVDNQFTQNADPRAFVYNSLQPGVERQNFLKSHFSNPQELQQFLASKAILKHQGALDGPQ